MCARQVYLLVLAFWLAADATLTCATSVPLVVVEEDVALTARLRTHRLIYAMSVASAGACIVDTAVPGVGVARLVGLGKSSRLVFMLNLSKTLTPLL